MGLLAIYRKGLLDWLRAGTRALPLARDDEGQHRPRKPSRFLERERRQRLKEAIGSMQRARSGRKPARRSTFQNFVIARIKTDESLAARARARPRPPKDQRESQATVLTQPLWLPSEEDLPEPERHGASNPLSSPGPDSPSPAVHPQAPQSTRHAPRQDHRGSIKFTMDIPPQLRNLDI